MTIKLLFSTKEFAKFGIPIGKSRIVLARQDQSDTP